MKRSIGRTSAALAAASALIGVLAFWAGTRVEHTRKPPAAMNTERAAPPGPGAANAAPSRTSTSVAPAPAQTQVHPKLTLPLRLGVVGDSGSLSYATRDWSMMEKLPLSWVDLMVECGGGDFGARTREPSSSGYARAWSGYGYSTADVIAHKLELEAARALAAGEVDAVIVVIGHDDFKSLLAARALKQQVTPSAVAAMLAGFEERYNAILDRLVAARRGTVIVHTLIDWYRLPFVAMMSLSPLESQCLAEATDRANAIITAAAERRRLPLVDLRGLFARLLASQPRLNGTYVETGAVGTESRFFFLPDGIHFGTAASALLLNGLLADWGPILGVDLPPLAEETIVRLSGIRPPEMRQVRATVQASATTPNPTGGNTQ